VDSLGSGQGLPVGSRECSDEPLFSGSTELVSILNNSLITR
jgi:hypothetical protein